jgi:hypothetical protein
VEIILIVGLIVLVAGGLGAATGGVFSSSASSCGGGCGGMNTTPGNAGNLNASFLETLASNAGFSGNDLLVAVAIALAESSGNPAAVGDVKLAPCKGPSIGLWQINIGKKAHGACYTEAQLLDPQSNANAAYAVYASAGGSFAPWSTYTSGAYAKYLPKCCCTGTQVAASKTCCCEEESAPQGA